MNVVSTVSVNTTTMMKRCFYAAIDVCLHGRREVCKATGTVAENTPTRSMNLSRGSLSIAVFRFVDVTAHHCPISGGKLRSEISFSVLMRL